VLENYDPIGRWRDREGGQPIETRETTVTGETLAGIDDLRKLFAARPERFYRGITEKLMIYAIGRGLEPFDAVTVDRITDNLVADNGRFSTLLLGIAQSPAFQMRRGDDGLTNEAPRLVMPTPPPPEQRVRQRRRFNFDANQINQRPPEAVPARPANPAPPPTP
jgi:hypothetical protein